MPNFWNKKIQIFFFYLFQTKDIKSGCRVPMNYLLISLDKFIKHKPLIFDDRCVSKCCTYFFIHMCEQSTLGVKDRNILVCKQKM